MIDSKLPEKVPDFKSIRKSLNITLDKVSQDTGVAKSPLYYMEEGITKNPSYWMVVTLNNYYYPLLNPAAEHGK